MASHSPLYWYFIFFRNVSHNADKNKIPKLSMFEKWILYTCIRGIVMYIYFEFTFLWKVYSEVLIFKCIVVIVLRCCWQQQTFFSIVATTKKSDRRCCLHIGKSLALLTSTQKNVWIRISPRIQNHMRIHTMISIRGLCFMKKSWGEKSCSTVSLRVYSYGNINKFKKTKTKFIKWFSPEFLKRAH